MNLESGKWYRLLDYTKVFRKCSETFVNTNSYGYFKYSEAIVDGAFIKDPGECVRKDLELVEDLTEIEPYLPEGHPDKKFVLNQQEENYSYLDKLLKKWNIK